MKIEVAKFGRLLISRPAGREALLVILAYHGITDTKEPIELDFSGVQVMAPSWLDEVLTGLREKFGNRVVCLPTTNPSVLESLKVIES